MDRHTEVELKWGLDAAAYALLAQRLESLLGPARVLAQDNRFFDTADHRLRTKRMNLRLRRENERLLLTCKRRERSEGEAHRHAEWEEWLDPTLWERIGSGDVRSLIPLPDEVVAVIGEAPLIDNGGFANLRREHRHQDELLCLDRTDFGVRVDHELEIETSDPDASACTWGVRLKEWRIGFQRRSETKFARFVALESQRPGMA
ncbi:MAG: CYTH domain-containing protein [Planctomycetes bacterium]|nr:CYTH domain-containing protein [Planctomycetota bacterium]